jgi:multidrug efflux pump subunit AcrA (membrane-fusion protein)
MREPKKAHLRGINLLSVSLSLLLLVIAVIIVGWIVHSHRKTGQMTLLESLAMDMTAMTAPKGSTPVAIEILKTGAFQTQVTYTGSTVPYNEQDLSPKISGWISDIKAYPGDAVVPGQVLALLNAPELSFQRNEAVSASEAAQAARQAARSEQKSAQARYTAAQADYTYWQAEIQREKNLLEAGAVAQKEYQRELAEYHKAKASLEEATADLKAAAFKLEENEALTHKEAYASQTAGIWQNYTVLRSALKGVVVQRLINKGSLVNPGQVILKIAQIDPIRFQANVAQADLKNIKVGNPVIISSAKLPAKSVTAKVSAVFPALDPGSRTGIVEAVFPNPKGEFLPGEYIVMKITKTSRSQALTIPTQAITEIDGKPAVWTAVENGYASIFYTCVMHPEVRSKTPGNCPKCGMALVPVASKGKLTAHLVSITTGGSDGERTEVLSGLKAGDIVIYEGQTYLNEGDAVYPTQWSGSGPVELPPPPAMENSSDMENMPDSRN